MEEQQRQKLDEVFKKLQTHTENHIEDRCINEEERKRNRNEFETLKESTYKSFGFDCPETNWML